MGWVDGDAPVGGEGTIEETDKAFIGGRDGGQEDKTIVLGIVERDGEVITRIVPTRKSVELIPNVKQHLQAGTAISRQTRHGPISRLPNMAAPTTPSIIKDACWRHFAATNSIEAFSYATFWSGC